MPSKLQETDQVIDTEDFRSHLGRRAKYLRRQANFILSIIVMVLFGGAIAFIFAADIAKFDLSAPPSLAAQLQAANARSKEVEERYSQIRKQIGDLTNTAKLTEGIDISISDKNEEINTLITEITIKGRRCDINSTEAVRGDMNLTITGSKKRPGEYYIILPDRTLYFLNHPRAEYCVEYISRFTDKINDQVNQRVYMQTQRADIENKHRESVRNELDKLEKTYGNLEIDLMALRRHAHTLRTKMALASITGREERSTQEDGNENISNIDWPFVIQTNATRFGAVLIVFFLVTILTPQYRYNLQLAAFYDARADGLSLFNELDTKVELEQIVALMTPNIQFGKGPKTPIQDVLELIKTLKE